MRTRGGRVLVLAVVALVAVALGVAAWQWTRSRPGEGVGAGARPPVAPGTPGAKKDPVVRPPAVAGLFYPKHPTALAAAIERHLAMAKTEPVAELRGLVVPHAGYEYSGPVAARAYKLLEGRDVQTAVVLAARHTANYYGAFVPGYDVCATPLGETPVSPKAAKLSRRAPYFSDVRYQVQRPGWWRESSRAAPAPGTDDPDMWEHSGEVQIPFLQKVLKDFSVLPVVCGALRPGEAEQAARALRRYVDEKTIVLASSDLSHDLPYARAVAADRRCVDAICRLDTEAVDGRQACGSEGIVILMHLAKQCGWQAKLLDLRNSGDIVGDKNARIVGYAAIAFYGPLPPLPTQVAGDYTAEERALLLKLARETVEAAARGQKLPVAGTSLPAKLQQARGCFVTLHKRGELRGCIGNLEGKKPLCQGVIEMAEAATLRDGRFRPVGPAELGEIEVEVSVLTEPQALAFASPEELVAKLQPGRDGVILELPGGRSATYLPQVWEQILDKQEFLSSLCRKAGAAPDAWRAAGVKVRTYQAEAFAEEE